MRDKRKESVIWYNEFQVYAHCDREPGEKLNSWQVRYVELNEAILIVIYNETEQSRWGVDTLTYLLNPGLIFRPQIVSQFLG